MNKKISFNQKLNCADGSLVKLSHEIALKDWNKYFERKAQKDYFYSKFEILTSYIYASTLYLVLIIRYINFVPLCEPLIKFGSKFLKIRRKIIFVSAFITLVDEVVDNIFTKDKEKQLKEVIYSNTKIEGKLELLRYICTELIKMKIDLKPIILWARKEDKKIKGEKDPEGLEFRKFGIDYGNELVEQAVNANLEEKKILKKASLLIQMTDDVIDVEIDKKNNTMTPAIKGIWNEETVKKEFFDLRDLIVSRIKSKKKAKIIEEAINWKMDWLIKNLEKME
jgi:hypothetical protein